jgi:hypothetical protein
MNAQPSRIWGFRHDIGTGTSEVDLNGRTAPYQTNRAIYGQVQQVNQSAMSGTLSQSVQAYGNLAGKLNDAAAAQSKLLALGGPTVAVYHGVSIGANAYIAALKQTDGSVTDANKLLFSSIDAYQQNSAASGAAAKAQQALSDYLNSRARATRSPPTGPTSTRPLWATARTNSPTPTRHRPRRAGRCTNSLGR